MHFCPFVLWGERWRIALLSQAAAWWSQFIPLNTCFLPEKRPCGTVQTSKAGTRTNCDALPQGRRCRSLPSPHSTNENRREKGVKVRTRILQPCSDSPGEKKEIKPMWMYCSFRTHQSSLARRFLMLLNLSNISQQHELFQYLPMGWLRGLDVVMTTVLYPFPLILMSEKDNPAQEQSTEAGANIQSLSLSMVTTRDAWHFYVEAFLKWKMALQSKWIRVQKISNLVESCQAYKLEAECFSNKIKHNKITTVTQEIYPATENHYNTWDFLLLLVVVGFFLSGYLQEGIFALNNTLLGI